MRLLKKWHVVQNNSYFALANETTIFILYSWIYPIEQGNNRNLYEVVGEQLNHSFNISHFSSLYIWAGKDLQTKIRHISPDRLVLLKPVNKTITNEFEATNNWIDNSFTKMKFHKCCWTFLNENDNFLSANEGKKAVSRIK